MICEELEQARVKRVLLLVALLGRCSRCLPTAICRRLIGRIGSFPIREQEAQAQALMEELRCLVCQGQSIADSDAELAGDMRDLVRRRIAAGEKPAAIRAWLVQRYGSWISYKPTAEPAAWPLVACADRAAARRRAGWSAGGSA